MACFAYERMHSRPVARPDAKIGNRDLELNSPLDALPVLQQARMQAAGCCRWVLLLAKFDACQRASSSSLLAEGGKKHPRADEEEGRLVILDDRGHTSEAGGMGACGRAAAGLRGQPWVKRLDVGDRDAGRRFRQLIRDGLTLLAIHCCTGGSWDRSTVQVPLFWTVTSRHPEEAVSGRVTFIRTSCSLEISSAD